MKGKDISKNHKSSAQIAEIEEAKLKTLMPIYQLGSRFLMVSDEQEIFELLLDVIQEQLDTSSVSIMILDKNSNYLKIIASRGLSEETLKIAKVKVGERISGWVFKHKTPLLFNRATQNQSEFAPLLQRKELSSSISFPMTNRNEVIGVINISQTKDQNQYSSVDIELVSILSQLTVTALENIRLARQKEEIVRIRTLFEQYVSPDVARLLLDEDHQLLDIGKVQELTVLFADIRNFTPLVQHLQLQQLRTFLNDFFDLFTKVVYQNQGTLDKFMGDGALVIFGAPISLRHPAEAAVKTGVEILRRFGELRKRYRNIDQCFAEIGLGIGISCGEMFIGNVGSQQRFDYTVIGAQVNVAQRLASHTSGDTLLITDQILRGFADDIRIDKTEKISLRGFPEKIVVHSVGLLDYLKSLTA